MTHPHGESLPNVHQIVESPAELPGLTPLEVGHSVEITRAGIDIPSGGPDDVVTILVGEYEGRKHDGTPFPYRENPEVDAVRIMDISKLSVTVRPDDETPFKPNYASFSWGPAEEGQYAPKPLFTPLVPEVEYPVTFGRYTAATYKVSEEGAVTVTRTYEAPDGRADVHVMGVSLGDKTRDDDYVQRPAQEAAVVTPGAVAMENFVHLGHGGAGMDLHGNFVVNPGTFNSEDANGALVTTTVTAPFAIPMARTGAFEADAAHNLAARQHEADHGKPSVDKFTTIGKQDEGSGGQPIV